ncbi:DNA-methyltransferase [Flavisolibacter nicotianae]|uniref:DNA-methyltransferase n=1 Tax=Flavisolibacter nicotianae TaxID=2364882 RepID=UPI000EB56D77|nr:site-specific DNA-methyltransferase [Flavisolibacter nicotianae]
MSIDKKKSNETEKIKRTRITTKYIHGDANKKLDELLKKKKRFQLIISSPPYNMDREYEKNSSFANYREEIESVISKLVLLLEENGSICWQVGSYVNKKTKEVLPLDIFFYELFKKHNLTLRNRIIWHFEHGLHASQRFSGRYETILWFTKSDKYTFNLDDVRVPAKYPGKTHYRGEKKGQISGNPKGKNPSDLWKIIESDWDKEVWSIPNVKANHKEKTIHPCQYPIELVERCILALSNEGDWVLDPYAGVGSTLIAARKNNRNSTGIEKYKKYINVGNQRIETLKKGTLKYRKLGTPVFQPNQNMAVARKPEFFNY